MRMPDDLNILEIKKRRAPVRVPFGSSKEFVTTPGKSVYFPTQKRSKIRLVISSLTVRPVSSPKERMALSTS